MSFNVTETNGPTEKLRLEHLRNIGLAKEAFERLYKNGLKNQYGVFIFHDGYSNAQMQPTVDKISATINYFSDTTCKYETYLALPPIADVKGVNFPDAIFHGEKSFWGNKKATFNFFLSATTCLNEPNIAGSLTGRQLLHALFMHDKDPREQTLLADEFAAKFGNRKTTIDLLTQEMKRGNFDYQDESRYGLTFKERIDALQNETYSRAAERVVNAVKYNRSKGWAASLHDSNPTQFITR